MPKGKKAWLVTWEGDDVAKSILGPKVAAILPPNLGRGQIPSVLKLLYESSYPLTLGEKMSFGLARGRDKMRLCHKIYRDINPVYNYGTPHCHLRARQVENLICQDNPRNDYENTLTWTELEKYVPDPDPSSTETRMVVPKRDDSYTYAITHDD